MLGVLKEWAPLRDITGDAGDHLFEVSVGYDLEGIQSDRMARFLDLLGDCGQILDDYRLRIPTSRLIATWSCPAVWPCGT